MARKNIIRILSGCCLFAVMFCIPGSYARDIEIEIETYTISGSIDGVEGVELQGFPDDQYVVTNSNGDYYATVEWNWSGTIKPKKDGYTFSPSSIPYSDVTKDMMDQDYKASAITYTISGRVGNMAGVELNGLPGNPLTGDDGSFSVIVEYGFSGLIQPYKEGYKFSPESEDITDLTSNKTLNFTPSAVELEIYGNVSAGGVEMVGLPGRVISDEDGSYSVKVEYNWSGKVTPKKEGYTFDPPSSEYTNVTYDQEQDYFGNPQQFVISGTTDIAGVLMEGFPEEVYTDSSGAYSVQVNYDWSGTITPTLGGYSFKPGSMIYSKVREDKTQDYKGSIRTYVIKGKTGISGVTMNGLPGNPVTAGPSGTYSVVVEYDWNGVVIPEKDGYSFRPEQREYSAVADDYQNDDYLSKLKEYEISGNLGEPDVILRGFPGKLVKTDDSGSYTATVKHNWSGKITPQKNGYTFDPPSILYENVNSDQFNQDYETKVRTYAISGIITTNRNKPVGGIEVSFGPLGSTTTNDDGSYSFEVEYNWEGGIMPDPDLEGYTFQPQSRIFTNKPVKSDMKNQNFKATIEMFTISDVLELRGRPLQGVEITANPGDIKTVSNSKGEFSFEVPYNWTGEYKLYREGIKFTPDIKSFANVTTDIHMDEPVYDNQPGTETPGTETPGTETPGLVTPSTETPGTETPGTETPGTETPGTETPILTTQSPEVQELLQIIADLKKENENNTPTITPNGSGEILITEEFIDDDLISALDIISSLAGIPMIYGETVQGVVNCKFDQVPLEKALEILLKPTPFFAKKVEGDFPYYLISEGTPDSITFMDISDTVVMKLDYISAMNARGYLSTPFQQYVKAVVDDPNARMVTITAPRLKLNRIIEDIKKFDTKPSQVLLEARIVVLEKGNLLNLGVEWGWPTLAEGATINQLHGLDTAIDLAGKTAWGVQMGYTPDATFTNALEQVLNLMQVNDEAKIVAAPSIVTQDNEQATMRVLNEEYYMIYATGLSETYYSRQEMEVITTGTVLTITPHISDTNDIEMKMAVEVSDSIPKSKESDLPKVTRRTAESTLRVYDGGSVAIAGLAENRIINTYKQVPLLGSIPVLGELFKSKSENNTTREVAIFVTASVLHETGKPQIGFTDGTSTIRNNNGGQFQMSDTMSNEMNQLRSQLNDYMDNNSSSSNYSTTPSNRNQRRVPPSVFDEDPFSTSFQDMGNSNTRARTTRSAPTRSLSPEEAFNMQINDRLASQGGRYGGSEY